MHKLYAPAIGRPHAESTESDSGNYGKVSHEIPKERGLRSFPVRTCKLLSTAAGHGVTTAASTGTISTWIGTREERRERESYVRV